MDDLKELLFKECLYLIERYKYTKETFGEFDYLTGQTQAKFCIIYDLIERAGLEDEYNEWSVGRRNETAATHSSALCQAFCLYSPSQMLMLYHQSTK